MNKRVNEQANEHSNDQDGDGYTEDEHLSSLGAPQGLKIKQFDSAQRIAVLLLLCQIAEPG